MASRVSLQLAASGLISVFLSVGLNWLLRAIFSTVTPPSSEGPSEGRRRPPVNVNPVAVFVVMPILVGNSHNAFGIHRSLIVGRRRRRKHR
ncbi:MAG TPA: hypothetical protein VFB34_10795 [Chloroflexota bacterium]|nr:hypothetical protein [Chloroflexota bacterium]